MVEESLKQEKVMPTTERRRRTKGEKRKIEEAGPGIEYTRIDSQVDV